MRNKKDEASSEAEDSGEETDYAEIEWDELDDQDFAKRMAVMAWWMIQMIWIGFLPDCVIKKVSYILPALEGCRRAWHVQVLSYFYIK